MESGIDALHVHILCKSVPILPLGLLCLLEKLETLTMHLKLRNSAFATGLEADPLAKTLTILCRIPPLYFFAFSLLQSDASTDSIPF